MRMNLFVATCSLLSFAGFAMKFDETDLDEDLAQLYYDYDYDQDLAETYGEDTEAELAGRIKGLEAKVDSLIKHQNSTPEPAKPEVVKVEKPAKVAPVQPVVVPKV